MFNVIIKEEGIIMKTIIIAISLLITAVGCGAPGKTVHPTPQRQRGIDFNQTGTVSIKTSKAIQSLPVASVDNLLANPLEGRSSGKDNLLISSNVELRLKVSSIDEAIDSIIDFAAKKEGLVLLSNNQQSDIRVPSDSLTALVRLVEKLGEITFRQVSRSNVTDQYINYEIDLENEEKTRQRFLELMKMADTVDEVIKIERELNRVTRNIGSFHKNLQKTENQIEYARVKIHISSPSESKPGPVGFIFYNLYKGASWLFVQD